MTARSDPAPGATRRRLRTAVTAVLAASAMLWVSGAPAGAWSSDDGAVAVFGGTNADYGYSVAVDSSGNVYTTGYFNGTVDFDPGAGTANLTSNGYKDVFVSKLDSSGNYVWAKNFGGTGNDMGYSVAVDSSGNVYTTGYFTGTVDFDPGAGTTNLVPNGSSDAFVSKLDSSGDLVWAKNLDVQIVGFGQFDRTALSIAVDSSGNVYTTGYFNGTVDFDPGAGTVEFTAAVTDAFVSKLDSSGNYVWAKSFGGDESYVKALSMAIDSSGNVYTTGSFATWGTTDFDPGPGTAELTSDSGFHDVFVSKLDSSGNYVWAKSFTGHGDDEATSIAVDSSGNVYTTGKFHSTVDFDPGAGTANVGSPGGQDVFVSKLDSSGNYVWAKNIESSNHIYSYSVAVDSSGNVYTTGSFGVGPVDFDPGSGTDSRTSNGVQQDVYVLKLDSAGDYVWAKNFGGTGNDMARSIAVDSSGNVYTTGQFYGTGPVDFDPGAGTANLTSNGNYDVFVLKLDSSGNLAPSGSAGVTVAVTGGSTSVSEAGSTDSFTVVLDAQPSSDVVISVGSADTGEATVAPAQLTFTSGNWDTAQTVTVTGVDDSAVDGTQTTAVTVAVVDGSSDDTYDPVADSTVSVTTSDDDTAAFTLSGTAVTVSEAGSTATFTAVLGAQPSSDVVLSVVSADTGEATVAPATLTFTSGNWNAAQTVTATGVDDNATDGNQTTAVTVAVVDASSDNAFDALADQTVTVTTSDDDSPGVSVTESDGSTGTTEGGGTDTFTVVLNTQPSSDVVIAIASSDTGEVTVSPTQLTFTSGNWNAAQTITATGVDDTTVDGTQNATITVSVVDSSSDDNYDPVGDVALSATNTENDNVTQTDCTLQANWNLSECACPPGQTRTSSSSGTCATTTPDPVAAGPEVVLSAFAVDDDGFVTWVPSRTDGLQSYVLAWRPPSGSWTTHSSYTDPNSLKDTLVGLADGDHRFRIYATYTDGAYAESDIAKITVPRPPPGPTVDPEPIDVEGFDCAAFPSLIQVMGTPGVGHSVKQLDVTSGQYSTIFSISANRTPSYTHLNGIGINPVDGALYGLMRVKGFGYLVRFDAAGNVAFVARVPAMSNAGDVDGEGTFVWPRGNSFYTLSGIAGMDGFADPGDAANKSQIAPLVTGTGGVADVAALRVDLGDGERPYAMGVNTSDHKLRIWAYDDTPQAWTINLVITDGSQALTNGGFGAAWSHEDRIYFSSNSGAGVYEIDVPSIDLNAKTADIRRVANSQATAINDGTTCIGIDIVIVDPPTDCTLQANWDLLECACPPDQARDDAGNCGNCPAGTEVVDGSCVDIEELEVVLSAFAVEDDGFVTWVPSRTDGLQSYVLTWRPPSGSWTTHSSYTDPNSLKETLVGLADGDHSFRVIATYTDGAYAESNIASITVPTPPPGPTDNPEPIDVDPFDCAAFPSLIQVMGTPGVGHSVKQLDINTGQYSTIFSISANRNPSYTHLNGIGINPVDGALYGLMRVKGFGYLVRFDAAGNVAFVARVPAMSNAGDVDDQGTFVWPRGNSFYTLSGIAGMEGFANPGDAANKSQIAPLVTGTGGVADVATLRVDLGDGERSYAMGVNTSDHKLRIWAYDDTPEAWTITLVITDGSQALTNGGFGAAWSHEDRIYFSSNSGAGVYEILVPSIDLNAKTADIRRVANSQATAINDGTTCIGIDIVIVDPTTDDPDDDPTTGDPDDDPTTGDPDDDPTTGDPDDDPTTGDPDPEPEPTTTEPPATTTEPPATTTEPTEEPESPETQDSDGDGISDSQEINQLGTDPFDATDPGDGVIRQALTSAEPEGTGSGTNWWKPIIVVLAAAGLLLLLVLRRRRCQHCEKRLTDRDGVLVDEDDNPDCADNPDGDHHQLKPR